MVALWLVARPAQTPAWSPPFSVVKLWTGIPASRVSCWGLASEPGDRPLQVVQEECRKQAKCIPGSGPWSLLASSDT